MVETSQTFTDMIRQSSWLNRPNMSQAEINVQTRESKKIATEHNNGCHRVGLIFLLMVLGAIVWGSYMIVSWMKDAHRLPLLWLVITGERHYTTNDDIRQAILTLEIPNSFMKHDVNIIQQKIEQIPWIKQVSVRKQWPNELKIYIVEYVPVARWNDLHLLDNSGKVFSAPEDRINNQPMPMLYGPEGSEKKILINYHNINEMLMSAKFQLKVVSMNARHSWQLMLRDDTKLELGRYDRTKRLQRFIGIYPVLLKQARNDNKRISYVDLRYDSGLAVGWTAAYIKP